MALLDIAQPLREEEIQRVAPPAVLQPFVWGRGGARLTPEQLAAQQSIARSMTQADYSPVGSVWEGLGRFANNVTGALELRSLKNEQSKINEDRSAQIARLLGEGNADLAPGIGSGDPVVSALAGDLLKSRMPKARNPLEFEQLLAASGFTPGTPQYTAEAAKILRARTDPFTNITTPDGQMIFGAQSLVEQALKGGGLASGVAPGINPTSPAPLPTAPVGKLTPIGGETPRASGNFP